MSKLFTNTGILMRFIFRRDRIRIPIWVISIVSFSVLIGAMLPELYPSDAERQIMAETMKNPAIIAMLGPGYGLDNYTYGAMMAHFMLAFTAIAVAIMSILLTTRHTREDEEDGRIEIIRSLPVGPLSSLTATFLISTLTYIVLSFAVGFGLYYLGLQSMDLKGSLLYGASLGSIGIFFVSITGLFAQLTTSARSTIGYSFAFLIIAYIMRGIGDVENEILSLISPLGLILRTEVYVTNYWWPVLITIVVSIILFGLALYLNSIRDLEAGFIPNKPGSSKASKLLSSALGLSLRLQRTAIIAWIIGMFVLGISYGSVLGDLEAFISSSEIIQRMIPESQGFNLSERFVAILMTVLSIIGTVPTLMFILKLRSEEKSGRTEHLHARPVSRNKIIGSYTVISFIAAPIIQLMSIFGLWFAGLFVMDDAIPLETFIKAGTVHLPAIWIMLGLAVFLIGFIPKLTGLIWLYLGYSFFTVYLGDMLQLPSWMGNLTPFGHIPQIPIEEANVLKMAALLLIAVGSTIAGFIGYNKRDIQE